MSNDLQIDYGYIENKYWRFSHDGGPIATEVLKFLPDGRISGYSHDNERYWNIENGMLSLLNKDRIITVTFDFVESNGGRLFLKGRHKGKVPILCLTEQSGRVRDSATKIALSDEIKNLGWSIGDHTYGVPGFIEKGMSKLVIGKYCSIAAGVKIAFGNHRIDTFTTFPFGVKRRFWEHVPHGVNDHASKGNVVIGSDVWIGVDVFIGSGVTIGSGAVIGAKSVVTKDVPPYAIVVGNPGRVVRYRFNHHIIEELLKLSWWDLSDELVDSLIPLLMSDNASSFISALNRLRSQRPSDKS